MRTKTWRETARQRQRVLFRKELTRRMKEAQKPFIPKLKSTDISHYANPSFVSAVEESSKNISRSASTVKRKGRKKGKRKGNLKKS